MNELRRCKTCLLPETHETLVIEDDGICNICKQHDWKKEKIDWQQRLQELDLLVESYRGQGRYDCLVPFSGGKDSTWTLYYLVKRYNIKPLVVRFNHGFLRATVRENSNRVFRQLGVDVHEFTPNWQVVQKLMLQSFLEKGDFCWHCHTGIFSYPMHVAIMYNIPLIFWGEPSAEYTAYFSYSEPEEVDQKRFNRYVNLGINAEDMLLRLNGMVSERDLWPFSYPPLRELRRIKYRSVCLGSYIPWDVKRHVEIIKQELGWKGDQVENVPPGYDYEKIECHMQGVRDYIKFIKRGYSRPTHLAALDLRNGRISLEAAKQMITEYEGKRPPSLDLFLDYVGLTEAEFLQIAISHAVAPYQHDPSLTKDGNRVHDYEEWWRDGAMPREVSKTICANCQQGCQVNL